MNVGVQHATTHSSLSHVGKLSACVSTLRITTRVWFDIIAPGAMLALLGDRTAPSMRYVLPVAAIVLTHAGHTLFNDLSDVEVDRHSSEPGRNRRASVLGRLSRRELVIGGWMLVAAGTASVLALPPVCIFTTLAALPLVLAYNFPPLHLSAKPLATQVFWPLVWILLFVFCGAAVEAHNWMHALPYIVFVVLFMGLGESITQDTRDADNDAAGGRTTTVVAFGVPRTTVASWIFQAASLGAWAWLSLSYPLPRLAAVTGGVILSVWLAYFLKLTLILQKSFDKASARMTHVGSIITFTVINVLVILVVVLLKLHRS